MTIILVFATMKCQHMRLSRKSSASRLRRACKNRQEAVIAVCLRIDRDINEVMQVLFLYLCRQQGEKAKSYQNYIFT